MQGYFISLESTEGAGKGTVAPFVRDCLVFSGLDVVSTREVGGTPMAEAQREAMLHRHDFNISALEESLMAMAGRYNHLRTLIQPALAAGRTVVTERFMDSTYVYQGIAGGVPRRQLDMLAELMYFEMPVLTFLLDIDPVLGFERATASARQLDRIEQRPIEFFHKVRNGYLQLVEEDKADRWAIIDASQSLPSVRRQIMAVLVKRGMMTSDACIKIMEKHHVVS